MWKADLLKNLICPLEEGRDLASLSTLGVGGRAECFVEPGDLRDVSALFQIRAGENFPLYILGGGSNVIFADGELRGVVLSARRLKDFQWKSRETEGVLEVEGGCPLPYVVSQTMREGFAGAEFATGIPGTVGGAVAGNAGAAGRSVGDLLVEITTVECDGTVRKWSRGEFDYSYRRFSLTAPARFFAGCKLRFLKADREEIERKGEFFRQGRMFQPRGVKSAGCFFKNPANDSAGRLLDISGCKGLRVGDAVVSDVHANFIFNEGRATAADVVKLMESCRDIVFRESGVLLEPEVKLLGFGS